MTDGNTKPHWESHWTEAHRPFVKVGAEPNELAALADAVIRGASIAHAEIDDLRLVLDAILASLSAHHSTNICQPADGSLAPVRLVVHGGIIGKCECDAWKGEFALLIHSRFTSRAYFGKATFGDATSLHGSWFEEGAVFTDASFGNWTKFDGAIFDLNTSFKGARFKNWATLVDCRFNEVDCSGCQFADWPRFKGALFLRGADFKGAQFGNWAEFHHCGFLGSANFDSASFENWARFDDASFRGDAYFEGARFGGWPRFDGAVFAGAAEFSRARFSEYLQFRKTHFCGQAVFDDAVFGLYVDLDKAFFENSLSIDARSLDVRGVRFGVRPIGQHIAPYRRPNVVAQNALSRGFGWTTVRGLGQLQVLTRVSVVALILVPVVAWAWPAIRYAFTSMGLREPHMGLSLALTFFAAVFVSIGQVLYQIFAPDLIRKQDADSFVEWAHRRYPEGAQDRDDGLRRATDALACMARLRPDRNPNLVAHHGQTVWIPSGTHIEWFQDSIQMENSEPELPASVPSASTVEGIIPGAERARIAIDEGARAEYWLTGRESLGWAWVSFACYLIAVWCFIMILVNQALSIGRAAGWGWWGGIAFVLLAAVVVGSALALRELSPSLVLNDRKK